MSVQLAALKFTVVSPAQSEKAYPSMDVTELGIVMDVSPLQPENAPPLIEVTELGISVF